MSQTLPQKISPSPLIEAIFELRFTTKLPQDALPGMLFAALRSHYGQMMALPIAQLPEAVRSADPNLQFQPSHQMIAGHHLLKIGARVLTFASLRHYDGWAQWLSHIEDVLTLVDKAGILDQVDRVGLRYVNFFPQPVLDQLNFEVQLMGQSLHGYRSNCRFEIPDSGLLKILQISNDITVQIDQKPVQGSMIDIDCIQAVQVSAADFFDQCAHLATTLHDKVKQLFFSILKEDFLKSLHPDYPPQQQ